MYDRDNVVYDIKLDLDKIYIPGSEFHGDPNRCYMPIFKNTMKERQDTWYMGNLFMKNHYSVFDMTPFERNNTSYLHIGLGEKAAADFVPDYSYNPARDPRPKPQDNSGNRVPIPGPNAPP